MVQGLSSHVIVDPLESCLFFIDFKKIFWYPTGSPKINRDVGGLKHTADLLLDLSGIPDISGLNAGKQQYSLFLCYRVVYHEVLKTSKEYVRDVTKVGVDRFLLL